ncbi:MAG: penicillin-binding protein 2 [Candidatus Moranbacteria bacterium]|nr:penicillin-binding protein 2 [Candidatus Moranbacteria bacterium]MBP9801176.1 penicillin-binding protein 2 [Candidatus Moranbacteria bacterium]
MKLFIRNLVHPSRRGREIDDAVLTVTEEDAARLEWPLSKGWFRGIWWISFFILILLAGRVFVLNTIQGEKYQSMAERNSLRMLAIPAPRGIIYDRAGQALVQNIPTLDLAVVPSDLPREEERRIQERELLSGIIDIDQEIATTVFGVKGSTVAPLLLKAGLTQEEMLIFLGRKEDFPGVVVVQSAEREYKDGLIFSHLIGYEGKIKQQELDAYPEYGSSDTIGKEGVEKAYEVFLRGKKGAQRVEVDALGRVKKELGIVQPIPGNDVILHINADLQKKVFDSLSALLETRQLKRAAAIVMNPETGGILALMSFPSYDNNLFSGGIDQKHYEEFLTNEARPLFNRAVSGEYPPGSTIKPVLAAAALAEGVVNEHTEIESRGGISIGKFFFGDWKVHGFTDIRRAIAVSSDVYFYSIGGGYGGISGLGMRRMKAYEEFFGYGKESGIDIPGEADGFLPDPDWKQNRFGERWYIGDDYHAAIGQGFVTATPLQVLNSIATISNGGVLREPRVVSHIRDATGKLSPIESPIVRRDFIDANILKIVLEGMRETVTEGTAQPLKDLPVAVAGKTGTAQFGTGKDTHGWFVSFAPYEKPEIAMIVLVEGQGEEGYNAVPVTKEVYQWYFDPKRDSK